MKTPMQIVHSQYSLVPEDLKLIDEYFLQRKSINFLFFFYQYLTIDVVARNESLPLALAAFPYAKRTDHYHCYRHVKSNLKLTSVIIPFVKDECLKSTYAIFQSVQRITKIFSFGFRCFSIVQNLFTYSCFNIKKFIECNTLHYVLK